MLRFRLSLWSLGLVGVSYAAVGDSQINVYLLDKLIDVAPFISGWWVMK